MIKFILGIFLPLMSFKCLGIDIGPMTFNLDSNLGFVNKTVTNNSPNRNIYTLNVYEINRPGSDEEIINEAKRDLLFNPRQFVLSGFSSKVVKFYFSGDNEEERYYRVDFSEMPAPQESNSRANMYLVVKFSSILVIGPKNKHFSYEIDYDNNMIINNGNTYFEFIVKETCETSDIESFTRYLLPGKSYRSDLITKNKVIVIITNNRFHFTNNTCK